MQIDLSVGRLTSLVHIFWAAVRSLPGIVTHMVGVSFSSSVMIEPS